MTIAKQMFRAFLVIAIFQLCAAAAEATYNLRVTIQGKGNVSYSTSGPSVSGPNGILQKSGSVKIEDDFFVYLYFIPGPLPPSSATSLITPPSSGGYRVEKVTDNGVDITSTVLSDYLEHSFTMTEDRHIVVQFAIDSPTGDFPLAFQEGSSSTPVRDVTGSYSGTLPTKGNSYTADVAMDESGKVMTMGSVDGFTNKDGENQVNAKGKVKTVNGVPTATGNASTEGTLDGDDVKGSGKAKIPVNVTTGEGGPAVEGVVASGSAKENDTRFAAKPEEVSIPAQPENVEQNWNFMLKLEEKTDAKGKKYVVASGILNLPNGDKTGFKEKRVNYSLTKGYSVSFARGEQLDAGGNPILDDKGKPVIDRKSRIAISKMLLRNNGSSWTPISGLLKYKFLGQKGEGDLVDFLPTAE